MHGRFITYVDVICRAMIAEKGGRKNRAIDE